MIEIKYNPDVQVWDKNHIEDRLRAVRRWLCEVVESTGDESIEWDASNNRWLIGKGNNVWFLHDPETHTMKISARHTSWSSEELECIKTLLIRRFLLWDYNK